MDFIWLAEAECHAFGECNDSFSGVRIENMAKYTRKAHKKRQKSQLNIG